MAHDTAQMHDAHAGPVNAQDAVGWRQPAPTDTNRYHKTRANPPTNTQQPYKLAHLATSPPVVQRTSPPLPAC